MHGLKLSRVDRSAPIRLITDDEEERLRSALRRRDKEKRNGRISANQWRRDRNRPTLREFGTFVDHLEPIVLLALNTGMRRGEILNLRWADVSANQLIVQGSIAKSSQSRVIPLNLEARQILRGWNSECEWVFPGADDSPLTTIKKSWSAIRKEAKTPELRFHDLRHTFATRVLEKGAHIKTVKELLGHADIATTARYLHATDETKRKAVDLL